MTTESTQEARWGPLGRAILDYHRGATSASIVVHSSLWEDDDYRLGTAKRYNISEEEIPDYYRERCALKTNIRPVDVANAALFLLSDKAAKLTGAILTVDGGVAFVR